MIVAGDFMVEIIIARALIQVDYPGQRTKTILDSSLFFDTYFFAFVLAAAISRSPIGKKLHLALKKILQKKTSRIKYLTILESIPFIFTLAVLAICLIARHHVWNDIMFVLSYLLMIFLFLFSYRWSTAIAEIRKERKSKDDDIT